MPASEIPNFEIGLFDIKGRKKPSLNKWTSMDRDPLDCGFEFSDIKVIRWRNTKGDYWVTPRNPLTYEFAPESTFWFLKRNPANGTVPLYDCHVDVTSKQDHFLSHASNCEGYLPTGMVGYAYISPEGTYNRPIYRCQGSRGHFASMRPDCENAGKMELLLGYGAA